MSGDRSGPDNGKATGKDTGKDTATDQDTESGNSDRSGKPRGGGMSIASLMAMAAILVAGAGLLVQEWRALSRAETLQSEIAVLDDALQTAQTNAKAAQDEAMRLSAEMATRLAALEAAMPDDPQAVFGEFAATQEALIQRLEALEAVPVPAADVAVGSGMALAQSGLTVASAMLADNLSGGDAGRWLPVLVDLQAAGLDLDNLDSLRAALSPPPPSSAQLLAEASMMMSSLRAAAGDGIGGWWSSTADRLAGFVTLRRQGETDDQPVIDNDSPLAGFEVAVARGTLQAALRESDGLAAVFPDHASAINVWRSAVIRRLAADDAVAGFSADMAARLALAAASGKAE